MDKAIKSMYKPSCDRGFTLIEIMIAVFILVIALLGLISTTVIVIKSNSLSKMMTAATTLAKDKMEPLKNTGYNDLAGGTDYCDKDSTCQSTSTANSVYTRTWTVSADGVPAAGMKTIAVTVQWNWQGSPHNVPMSTIVAR
ncbi:MAG: prepilin-type N-terminal cleavage/methylation domain-containing protein [Deltaproteobacteria bacterium]|nr:prepilin-type N-terminal cleavage/methylation domain-containing protein [Deltaproteobacteria bacterium]